MSPEELAGNVLKIRARLNGAIEEARLWLWKGPGEADRCPAGWVKLAEERISAGELGSAERVCEELERRVDAARELSRLAAPEVAGHADDGAPVDERAPDVVEGQGEDVEESPGDRWAAWRDATGEEVGREAPGDAGGRMVLVPDEELRRGLSMVIVAVHAYYPPARPGASQYATPLLVLQGHRLGARGALGPLVNVKMKSYIRAALAGELASAGVSLADLDAQTVRKSLPPAGSTETGTWWPVRTGLSGWQALVGLADVQLLGGGERADLYRFRLWKWSPAATARGVAARDPSWRAFPAQLPHEERPSWAVARRAPDPPATDVADLTGEVAPPRRAAPAKGPAKKGPPKKAARKGAK